MAGQPTTPTFVSSAKSATAVLRTLQHSHRHIRDSWLRFVVPSARIRFAYWNSLKGSSDEQGAALPDSAAHLGQSWTRPGGRVRRTG